MRLLYQVSYALANHSMYLCWSTREEYNENLFHVHVSSIFHGALVGVGSPWLTYLINQSWVFPKEPRVLVPQIFKDWV